jgi:hypothetical protein
MWQLKRENHSWVWADLVCEQVCLLHNNDVARGEPSIELTGLCRHAVTTILDFIFIYDGLKGGKESFVSFHLKGVDD